jgi:hypothetical protein
LFDLGPLVTASADLSVDVVKPASTRLCPWDQGERAQG